MKKIIILTSCLLLLAGSCFARTWKSADGSKTFEGTLRSYDAESGSVTVVVNGRPMTFPQDKLSAEDIAFLKEEEAKMSQVDPEEALAETEVGAKMLRAKLHQLDGKRYKRTKLDRAPDFYFFYYSASW